MNDLVVILSVGALFILFAVMARLYNATLDFIVMLKDNFVGGFHRARTERERADTGNLISRVSADQFTPVMPEGAQPFIFEEGVLLNRANPCSEILPAPGVSITRGLLLGFGEEIDEFETLPTVPSDWQEEMDKLRDRNDALVREANRMVAFFADKKIVLLSTHGPAKNTPSCVDDAHSVLWVKTPKNTEQSALIYDFNFETRVFQDVGQHQYGKVTQVLMNEGDTLVRLQTLTAPNARRIADQIGETPKPQRRSSSMPDNVKAYLAALDLDDLEMLKDFTGLDRNDPIKDGMSLGSQLKRKIDISD